MAKNDSGATEQASTTAAAPTAKQPIEYVRATDAETERVRKAWESGERIPEGFHVHFGNEGGETVLIVEKRA